MQSISVCLNNKIVGHLTKEIPTKIDSLTFCYDSDYVNQSDSVPISLSIPLTHEPYSSKIIVPYFKKLWGDLALCFQENMTSDVGSLSLGAPISKTPKPYTRLNVSEIVFTQGGLKDTQCHSSPLSHTSFIGGEFYDTPYDLLKTHILKRETATDQKISNLVSNEIFVTLIAYNFGIPVPTISRFTIDNIAYLIMDRPDREASASSSSLPQFQHCETLAMASIGFDFSGVSLKKNKKSPPSRITPEQIFNLIRHYGLRPALDFRTLIRAMTLCLTAGCDDFDLSSALISLKPNGCRLTQLRNFICLEKDTDNQGSSISKKFLEDIFCIDEFDGLTDQHVNTLARQISVHNKYLKEQFKEGSLILSKIAGEILEDYPSLKNDTTVHIKNLMEKRATRMQELLF